MRKLNISGLVKKCKQLWNNIVEALEEEVDTDEFPKEVFPQKDEAKEAVIEEAVEKDSEDSEEEPEENFSLDAVKDLFDLYIGVIITGFLACQEDVPDLEGKVKTLMITGVEIRGRDLIIRLTKINGTHGGYLKISPGIGGMFSEKEVDDKPTKTSRYRISLFGEDAIEYSDKNNQGQISYFAGYP